MRKVVLAIVMVLQVSAAVADDAKQQPRKAETSLIPRPSAASSCAIYGAGFVKVEGSSTCVKIGGSITVESGSRAR